MIGMIDFAKPYLSAANDGFKAEMLWWKWATKADVEIPVMEFSSYEGKLYAAFFAPDQYEKPTVVIGADVQSDYTRYHLWTCMALHTGEKVPLILTGDESNNEAVHKILWASGFGQWTIEHAPPQVVLDGLQSEDDNTHAMSVMAMRLLGHNLTVRAGIADLKLEPLTYHAALVAQVCPHLPIRL